jgi:hypothetical protein
MVSLDESLQLLDLLSDSCVLRVAELLAFGAESGYLHPDDLAAYLAAKDRINWRITSSQDSLQEVK